jgi:hypothetical protein
MRALNDAFGASGEPEAFVFNGNAATRLEWEGTGFDMAVMGGNFRSSAPVTALAPAFQGMLQSETLPDFVELDGLLDTNPLTIKWPRTWMGGAELSSVVGPVGIRAEGAWWSNKVVQQPWLNSTTRPAVAGGIGLDWTYGSHLFIAVEGRYHRWIDAPSSMAFTAEETVDFGGTTRVSLAQDRLTLQAGGIMSLTFSEYMARPEVRWRVSDPLSIGVGAILIGGEDEAPVTLLDALAWTGGPLSAFQENDSVFATLRWAL